MSMARINVIWELDGVDIEETNLPNVVTLPANIDSSDSDAVCNHLSNEWGFLVESYTFHP
jgi:hypothetical protein